MSPRTEAEWALWHKQRPDLAPKPVKVKRPKPAPRVVDWDAVLARWDIWLREREAAE